MDVVVAILKILGSLGVFLYGMKVMSEGIQRTAGERMRKVMATMTHNRFAGVGTGLVTTGLLQSSSATTVMVVSFVNAGLLTLVESIGIIMGANLGTTLTAWIIAWVGKISIAKIALPIIGVGLPIFFVGKNKARSLGEALIGFGLLFYGLGLLKDSVPDLKSMVNAGKDTAEYATAVNVQEFISGLSGHGYGSLLIFLFIGIVLTLIVQSSSAAMAITVTMAINGYIGFEESAAVVLGENIGTTVTAWLASLGANVNARRAARAHLVFNVIGVLWMLVAFKAFVPGVEWIAEQLPESMRTEKHDSDMGFSLAIFHSMFNFLNILLLIGFVPLIAKVVTKWVKDDSAADDGRRRLKFISQSRLDVGELNMPEAEEAIRELARLTRDMLDGYATVFDAPDKDLSTEIVRLKQMEDDADVLTHDITEYLVLCSTAEISTENAAIVASMIRMVSELEEITDALYRLIKFTERKYSKNREFTDEATDGVREMVASLQEAFRWLSQRLFDPLSHGDVDAVKAIEKKTHHLKKRFNKAAMKRIQAEGGDVRAEMLTVDMNNHLGALASYVRNVVEIAYYGQHPEEAPDGLDEEDEE
jgi:phosphate:Na+ symporter